MPSVTVNHPVTLEDATKVLEERLGGRYSVSASRRGSRESIAVRHALSMANGHLVRHGDTTSFRVHGGGLIVNRLVNEFGIARKVARAFKDGAATGGRT